MSKNLERQIINKIVDRDIDLIIVVRDYEFPGEIREFTDASGSRRVMVLDKLTYGWLVSWADSNFNTTTGVECDTIYGIKIVKDLPVERTRQLAARTADER